MNEKLSPCSFQRLFKNKFTESKLQLFFELPGMGKPTSSTLDRCVGYIAYSALMINIDDRNNLPRARCFSASEAAIRIGHIRSRDRMVFQSHAIIGWSMVWLW